MKVLGIDEAGRGPVLGSMFIGGFMLDDSREKELEDLGVKDSKKLSDRKRERIARELEDMGESFVKEIEAREIDELREVINLNEIEINGFARVIEEFEPGQVIVDLPEPDGERFIGKLKKELPGRYRETDFIAEHGADDEYPVVSAASILAKSAREKHVDELKKKYGYDFKSGYPHDVEVREFLAKYLEEHGELPYEARASWSTSQKILKKHEQSGLQDY